MLQRTPKFVFSNQPGKYAVGLKVVNQYDYTRTYVDIDNVGKHKSSETARPMQTLIWYPAEASNKPHMVYGDYLKLAASKVDFSPDAVRIAMIAKEDETYKDVMNAKAWAVEDAPQVKGSFPVVIYAPSFSSYPFENEDLCEYLASHGYLVIASPSIGTHAYNMSADLVGINTQAADIGFLIGYARTWPQADMSHIAVAGFSWGGISNLFAAARDSRVKALVSFDGSARYYPKLVHDAGDVKPGQMSLPILFLEQEGGMEQFQRYKLDLSSSVLNDLKYSDLTIVRMHAMHHGDFASSFQRSADYQTGRGPTEYTAAEAWDSYNWACRYALGVS